MSKMHESKRKFKILLCAFLINNILRLNLSQAIKFYPLEQDDFETPCELGLLKNDNITFKSYIPLNRSDIFYNNTYIEYQVTNIQKDIFLALKQVSMECEENVNPIECKKFEDRLIFLYKTKANDTNVKITVSLKRNQTIIGNDSQVFPLTYDADRNASGRVFINDIPISIDNCTTKINSHDLKLQFNCSSPAKPCVIEIKANNSSTFHNESAIWNTWLHNEEVLEISIKYAACTLKGNVSNIRCIVKVETTSSTEDNDETNIKIGFGSLAGVVISAIILLAILCFIKKWKSRSTNNRRFSGLCPWVSDHQLNGESDTHQHLAGDAQCLSDVQDTQSTAEEDKECLNTVKDNRKTSEEETLYLNNGQENRTISDFRNTKHWISNIDATKIAVDQKKTRLNYEEMNRKEVVQFIKIKLWEFKEKEKPSSNDFIIFVTAFLSSFRENLQKENYIVPKMDSTVLTKEIDNYIERIVYICIGYLLKTKKICNIGQSDKDFDYAVLDDIKSSYKLTEALLT